jgi:histidinol-phosphatase (PHP family)
MNSANSMKRRRTIQLFDGHTHSDHSPDGGQTIDELCQSAITHGLHGVTITDHCDMWFYDSTDTYTRMTSSIADAEIAREKYDGTLWVGTGVEVAEYMFDPTHAEQIMNLTDYDVIIGSVHSIAYDNWDSYSRANFDMTVPREKILTYLKRYFAEMQRMIECAHINVLAHITCPFRYINGKYGRNIDASIFAEQIEQILHDIIDKGIALELNTSGLNIGWGEFVPNREIR